MVKDLCTNGKGFSMVCAFGFCLILVCCATGVYRFSTARNYAIVCTYATFLTGIF
jgi:hypothetical protein